MGKIIILEDDRAFSLALSSLLVHEGAEVATAARPSEALEMINAAGATTISYLLVDCLLPDENGVDFVVRNAALMKQKKIQVVLMSGILTDQNFVRDSLRQTRAIEFLKKPFATADLLKVLNFSKRANNFTPGKFSIG